MSVTPAAAQATEADFGKWLEKGEYSVDRKGGNYCVFGKKYKRMKYEYDMEEMEKEKEKEKLVKKWELELQQMVENMEESKKKVSKLEKEIAEAETDKATDQTEEKRKEIEEKKKELEEELKEERGWVKELKIRIYKYKKEKEEIVDDNLIFLEGRELKKKEEEREKKKKKERKKGLKDINKKKYGKEVIKLGKEEKKEVERKCREEGGEVLDEQMIKDSKNIRIDGDLMFFDLGERKSCVWCFYSGK
ncbi:MAG: hypothetical protein F6K48_04105 [Okeania sp. SIO3H1]|nr:hypothetical protein [Okeania sp. SIO3H1]